MKKQNIAFYAIFTFDILNMTFNKVPQKFQKYGLSKKCLKSFIKSECCGGCTCLEENKHPNISQFCKKNTQYFSLIYLSLIRN